MGYLHTTIKEFAVSATATLPDQVTTTTFPTVLAWWTNHRADLNTQLATAPVIGIADYGSHLYGLNRPASDRDLLVVLDADKEAKPVQVITPVVDLQLWPIHAFLDAVQDAQPNMTDPLVVMQYTRTPWQPLLTSLHPSASRYLERSEAHAHNYVTRARNEPENRAIKTCRTALRNACINVRMMDTGTLAPRFTPPQAERFNMMVDTYTRQRPETLDVLYQQARDIMQ